MSLHPRHGISDGVAACRPAVWFIASSLNPSFATEPGQSCQHMKPIMVETRELGLTDGYSTKPPIALPILPAPFFIGETFFVAQFALKARVLLAPIGPWRRFQ